MKVKKWFLILLTMSMVCLALWIAPRLNKTKNNPALNISEASNSYSTAVDSKAENSDKITVPILMYHHFDPQLEAESNEIMKPENFRLQMELLLAEGYRPVSLQDLIAYVYKGKSLPDKPVCITFDDGYESDYMYAYPILKELNIPATCFVIGSTFGSAYYKDTENPITPHFGEDAVEEMTASGFMDIQSHTFDWHQWAAYELDNSLIREDILRHEDETIDEYTAAFTADCRLFNGLMSKLGLNKANAFAFPRGKVDPNAGAVLNNEGIKLTVTTNPQKKNVIIEGSPQSLIELGRINMTDNISKERLLTYLETGTA